MTRTSEGFRTTRRTGTWLVAAAFLVTMIGTTMPTPLYPLYERELGFGGLMVTVVFATYAVGVLAALLLVGRLSDQVGRKAVLLPGIGVAAASSLVFLIPDSLPALFAGRLLSGVSAGVFTGVATATIVDLAPPTGRARAGLLAAMVNMLGLGLGPVLSGALADLAPYPAQGASFRAGLQAVTGAAPAERRSEVSSSYFLVLYIAISIPVIGVGAGAQVFGLVPTAVVFAGIVALLAVGAFVSLLRRPA